ncbi:hypothetical protein BDP27DRAFT_1525866 [Rhodocollybia butyracea]|uniref:Uncharacterized protein n=1 Tax=Rhodocollybia butyracea TaxID=206335 RepID=A0A9P5TVV5_9AGAR|nr:hypothetical protein BDP27DRAFT_1525866 [Rhodocollybia butyracea]
MTSAFSNPPSLPPRTPYTPFIPFSTQQSAFPSALGKPKSPYSRLLEDSDEPLAKLYTQILRFVERDLSSIMEVDLGGVVFAAGRPDEFLKSYEITQAFIRSLELMAPSAQAVESLRAHPVYTIFEKRWQLPVYFQMRRKKIVSKVEEAFTLPVELSRKITGRYG